MITANIIDLLNQRYNALTKSEKRIANFIYDNSFDVQYMSITTLAESCSVADATIFRFCKSLGFNGYNELKLSLAKSFVPKGQQAEDSEPVTYGQVTQKDSFPDLCRKLYNTEVSAMEQTMELLDERSIRTAVDIMSKAKRVYCFGQGGSLIIAMEAWARFLSISPNFFYVEDAHLQATAASLLGPDDAVLFFSYSGATRDLQDVLPTAHANGAKIILVTHFENSPAAAHADVMLLCGSNEGPLQVGSVAVKVAQLYIIDVLYNEFWRSNPDLSSRNSEQTADAMARKLL